MSSLTLNCVDRSKKATSESAALSTFIVQAIRHGYPVMIHQSAGAFGGQVRAPILFPDS